MAQQIAVAARAIVPSRMLRLTTTEARVPPTRTRRRTFSGFIHLLYRTVRTVTIHGHTSVNEDSGIAGDDAFRVFHYPPLPEILPRQIRISKSARRWEVIERRNQTQIIHRITHNDRTRITLCERR